MNTALILSKLRRTFELVDLDEQTQADTHRKLDQAKITVIRDAMLSPTDAVGAERNRWLVSKRLMTHAF